MAVPTWVGAGTVIYDSALSWPQNLTVGASNLPAGIANGDSLLLLVTVSYGQRTFPTPVDDTLGSFAGLSAWTPIGTSQFSASGGASTGFWQLWAYVMQYDPSAFPFAVTPIGTTSGTQYTPILSGGNYRAQMFAWNPPLLYGTRSDGTASNNATVIPSLNRNVSLTDSQGIVIAAAALPSSETGTGGTIGSLSAANGFTEQHHESPILNHGGSLKVADYVPGTTGTISGPQWTKPTGPSGVSMLITLVTTTGGKDWGMNVVRW